MRETLADASAVHPLQPRPDQQAAHDAVLDALAAGIHRPLCVKPCGWGKSLLLGMLAATLSLRGRVLVLAHRSELLEQDAGAMLRLDPELDVGVCSASLKSDRLDARVVVGGTATIYRRLHRIGRFAHILLDEAHMVGPGATSMLAQILDHLGNPPLIGVTATAYRTDSGSLIDAGIFEQIVHETTLTDALEAGLLVPLRTKVPERGRIETTDVRITAGEFNAADLEAAALRGDATEAAVKRAVDVANAENRRSMIFFSCGVQHAHRIADALLGHGIEAGVITGTTPADERADLIARFRAGTLRALANCNVLTVGFDAPNTDLIAFMRPTTSPVLWVQSCGRGMRTATGKADCRLLDFGNNLLRHGPIDDVRLRAAGERHDARAAAGKSRICRACEEAVPVSATTCPSCGESLVHVRKVTVAERESTASALGGNGRWLEVVGMRGGIHHKAGGTDSFRLNFRTRDEGEIADFLPVEHSSNGARWHAERKWKRLSQSQHARPPASATEAFSRYARGELLAPRRIRVERSDGYWRITDVEVA